MLRTLMLVLTLSPVVVSAGDSAFSGTVAIASTGIDRPYPETHTDHSLAPVVLGRWRNLYFEGNRVSVGLHQGDGWSLAALAQLRMHQYTDDRDRSLDAGAVITAPIGRFMLQAAAMHDVSGAHGGAEYEFRAFTTWTRGLLTLVPAVAVQRQDDDLAGYYFGVPAMTSHQYEALAILAVNDAWVLVGSLRHIDHGAAGIGNTTAWAVGIGRRF
ncbi:MAG: MipA/OmpV family protein [Gammaproteobacteria bacterium]